MTLKRDAKSGAYKDRIRLPEDVRLKYRAQFGGPAWEEKFHRSVDTPPDKAVAEHAAWAAKVKGRIATLRDSNGSKGVDLTQRQADALAGDWYRWFLDQHNDNPGHISHWSELKQRALELLDLDQDDAVGRIAIEAHVERFLTDRGVTLSKGSAALLLNSVSREFIAAASTLERRAGGDWSADQHMTELAPYQPLVSGAALGRPNGRSGSTATAVTAVALFEAYCQDKRRAVSTINRWRCVFTALDALPAQETVRDQRGAQRWLDGLVGTGTPPRGHRTVRETWLSASTTVFGWGVRHGRVEVNPFDGCVVEVPRQTITRETGKAFTDAEALTILSAALRVEVPPLGRRGWQWAATRRWVPWLCAYTGARVGEITQCRAGDIEQRPYGPVLRITPDAGPVKTGKALTVPIHPHLVEMGLMDYVAAVEAHLGKQGPLFYQPPSRPSRNPNYRGPAVKARERLAAWVRGLGVTDTEIQPNHGWRHTFKQIAARHMTERVSDAITGHTPLTVGRGYGPPTVKDMAEALKHLPRYKVK